RIFVNDFAFVASLRNFHRQSERPTVAEQIAIAKLRADDSALKCSVAEREANFFALGFFGGNIQEKHVFVSDWSRLNLQDIEKAGPHQSAKTLVQSFGTVSLALQSGEPFLDEARTQSGQAVYKNFATEVIKLAGRNRHVDWNAAVDRSRGLRRRGFDFHFIITTRSIKSLQPTRDVGNARVGERLFQQIFDLSAQGIRAVNRLSTKSNVAKGILPALVNRNDHVDTVRFIVKDIARLIDNGVEETFRDIQAVDQVDAFLN